MNLEKTTIILMLLILATSVLAVTVGEIKVELPIPQVQTSTEPTAPVSEPSSEPAPSTPAIGSSTSDECAPVFTSLTLGDTTYVAEKLNISKWSKPTVLYNKDKKIRASFKAGKEDCKIYQYTFEIWTGEPSTNCDDDKTCLRLQPDSFANDSETPINIGNSGVLLTRSDLKLNSAQKVFVTGVGETTIGEQLKMNKGDKKDLWVRVETYPKTGKPNKGDWLDSPSYPFILNYEGEITTGKKK